jgi:hypothetical protein
VGSEERNRGGEVPVLPRCRRVHRSAQVTLEGPDYTTLRLENRGQQALEHLAILQVEGDRAAWQTVPTLDGGASRTVALEARAGFARLREARDQASTYLRAGLVSEGLYPAEASAMIKTWEAAWFRESGARVLYVLPRPWTDAALPLYLAPAPRELVRVMVGRAEVITPERESALLQQIVRFGYGNAEERAEAIRETGRSG